MELKHTRGAALVAAIALAASCCARAAPVTFSFTGMVTQVAALDPGSPFPQAVDLGTAFSGNYTFDSAAPNGAADPGTSGAYAAALGGFSISLGGLTLVYDGLSIVIQTSPGFDFYGAIHSEDPSADKPSGALIDIALSDYAGTALAGTGLPMLPPLLSLFDLTNSFFLTDTIDGNQVELGGAIDSLQCTAGCPLSEPVAPLLLPMALGIAALARRLRAR